MSGEGTNGTQNGVRKSRAACVLLHAPAAAVPTSLLATLSERMQRVTLHSDAYLALAELCVAKRTGTVALVLVEPAQISDIDELIDAARLHAPGVPIWWSSKHDRRGLVKLEPDHRSPWIAAEPLRASGPRLASSIGPETPRLKPGGAAAFRPAGKTPRQTNEPPRIVVRSGGGIGIRRLRLVGEDPARPKSPATGPGAPANAGPLELAADTTEDSRNRQPLLSEEELRMLLGDDEPGTPNQPGQKRSER